MGEHGRFARADAGRRRDHRKNITGHHGDIAGTVSAKWEKGTGGPASDEGQNLIAFSSKDFGADAGPLSPPVRAMNFDSSHPNAGGQIAVAMSLKSSAIVRRITARECERLFGLPDDWTLLDQGSANRDIVERAATAIYLVDSGYSLADAWQLSDVPDGPRFRHLGNAMALPVIGWILGRITEIENAR
jgi:DNA (cytosine-5)-methyltransferase 1